MRKQSGITLIALVITIIVLLILAGVAIAMLSGQNGVMNRASEARYENTLASVNEQVRLAALSLKTTITAKMIGSSGYLATGSDAGRYDYAGTLTPAASEKTEAKNFGELVKEVANGLNAKSTITTTGTEGYSIMGYIDTRGTETEDGYGYIYITYSDNSLRASLPTNSNDSNNVIGKSLWLSNGVKYNASALANKQDANEAVVAYVIEVTNYDCTLLGSTSKNSTGVDAVLTKNSTVNADFGKTGYNGTTATAQTSIRTVLVPTK